MPRVVQRFCPVLCGLATGMLAMRACPCLATDTVETWGPGAIDAELYLRADKVVPRTENALLGSEMVWGLGLVERLSMYTAMSVESDGLLADAVATHRFGVFGTPLDTPAFDLDLFLGLGDGPPDGSGLQLEPALELNFDATPDRSTIGAYLRVSFAVFGRTLTPPDRPQGSVTRVTWKMESTVGAYFKPGKRHELLLEHTLGYHPDPAVGEDAFERGSSALGYNLALCDSFELIHQLTLALPHNDEQAALGASVGFIATIPR